MEKTQIQSRYIYDALSFTTSNSSHDLGYIIKLLGLEYAPFTWQYIHGAKTYKERAYYDGININYGSDMPNQYAWVELSGQGCRVFETYGHGDYNYLFDWILNSDGVQITRLDIAFDDREQLLYLNLVSEYLESGNYASRLRTWEITKDNKCGITIYLGSKKANMFFRLYDKAIERGFLDRSCGHWIRVECQLRHYKAESWISNGFKPTNIIGLLSDLIRFTSTDSNDSVISRRPSADWWDKFIDGAVRCHLFDKPGVVYNIENLKKYVFGMAAPSIYAAIEHYGVNTFLHYIQYDKEYLTKDRYNNNPKYDFIRKEKEQCSNVV